MKNKKGFIERAPEFKTMWKTYEELPASNKAKKGKGKSSK